MPNFLNSMNPFGSYRNRDPYANQRKFAVNFPSPEPEPEVPSPYEQASGVDFSKFYEQPGPASQAYSDHLGKVPNQQDYAPSKWRRLGAILSGVSEGMKGGNSYEAARDINLDPYKQGYQRWVEQGAGLKESAGMEEATARNRSTFMQKILSDYIDQQYKQGQLEIGRAGVRNVADRNTIEQRKAEIDADYKAGLISATEARNKIYGLSVQNTGNYQQGQLGLGRDRNTIAQQGNDITKYLGERRSYDAGKGRELQRELNSTRPGAFFSGSDLGWMDHLATQEMLRVNPRFSSIYDSTTGRFDTSDLNPEELQYFLSNFEQAKAKVRSSTPKVR
jgi:hypothetical protein